MKINSVGIINSYQRVTSDYKSIRRKISPEHSAVNFSGEVREISTRRVSEEISKFIVDANLTVPQKKIEKTEKSKKKDVIEKYDGHLAKLRRAPILDRLDYVIEKLKQGEFVSATTMATLSLVYGPEDLRDVSSAYRQIKSLFGKENFIPDYDYKVAQHPYSFFRGSILHKSLNPFANNGIKLEELTGIKKWWYTTVAKTKAWLLEADKALIDTKIGEKFLDKFNIDIKKVSTPIEEIAQNGKTKNLVDAYEFISDSKFGKLTARALTRVPVIGTFTDAMVEVLEVRNDIMKGKNFFESALDGGIRYGTSTITTAYLGAIGSKAGPLGTLGALTLANYINETIEKAIEST